MDIKIIIVETYVVRNSIRHQHWSLNKVDTQTHLWKPNQRRHFTVPMLFYFLCGQIVLISYWHAIFQKNYNFYPVLWANIFKLWHFPTFSDLISFYNVGTYIDFSKFYRMRYKYYRLIDYKTTLRTIVYVEPP